MLLWGATVLKKTLPVKYKPNTSPAVLEQFLIQMKGPKELLVNILHKIPSLSPVLPHTQSKTQHVNGEAVQEQILVSQTATTPKNFWNISIILLPSLSVQQRSSCTFLINMLLFILMSMLTGVSGNASNTSCRSGIRLSFPSH